MAAFHGRTDGFSFPRIGVIFGMLLPLATLSAGKELPVPQFQLLAPSGWRLQDGAINMRIDVEISASEHVNADCIAKFGDNSSPQTFPWSANLTFSHTYPTTGSFNTTLYCNNSINEVWDTAVTVLVHGDVPIKGLTAIVPGFVLTDTPVNIKLSAAEGTDILYRVSPGSDQPVWILTTDTDTSKTVSHTFTTPGRTTIVVTATNEVSFAQARPKTEVIKPVTGFQLKSTHFVASHTETVVFSLVTPGTEFFPMGPLSIEFFENNTSIASKKSITVTTGSVSEVLARNFTLGKHSIAARISSPLDEQEMSLTLYVIEPLTEFNSSDVEFEVDRVTPMNSSQTEANVSIEISVSEIIDVNYPPPLGIQITWDFGDGSDPEVEFITSWEKEHSYKERGSYSINITVKVIGSTVVNVVTVPVRIGVLATQVSPLTGSVGSTVFNISISGVTGDLVTYLVDFGDELVKVNQTDVSEDNLTRVEHVYTQASIFLVQVLAWGETFAEQIYLDTVVMVYYPVESFDVSWEQHQIGMLPARLAFSVNFIEPLPSNASCTVNFGDGRNGTLEVEHPVVEWPDTTEPTSMTEVMETNSAVYGMVNTTAQLTTDAILLVENVTANYTSNDSTTDIETTAAETIQTTPQEAVKQIVSLSIDHNYTGFGKFSLEVVCHNPVTNVSRQWSITVAGSAETANTTAVHFCLIVLAAVLLFNR